MELSGYIILFFELTIIKVTLRLNRAEEIYPFSVLATIKSPPTTALSQYFSMLLKSVKNMVVKKHIKKKIHTRTMVRFFRFFRNLQNPVHAEFRLCNTSYSSLCV